MVGKALLTAGGIGLAIGVWWTWFYLEEQRRWGQPISVRDPAPINMDRFRRAL